MRRIILTAATLSLLPIYSGLAQNAFWSYDENNNETMIPIQCDGQFDETHGGVFMPTPDELYDQGELFLLEKGETRNNAGYCLLSAAIQGNVKAQYRVAQLYNKGIVLPQNDIMAYRWAFLASLNGSTEAEQLALTLEQVLSADEIKLATDTIEPMLPTMQEANNADLKVQEDLINEKKETLEKINKEIDEILGVDFTPPEIIKTGEEKTAETKKLDAKEEIPALKGGNASQNTVSKTPAQNNLIFTEKDRLKK